MYVHVHGCVDACKCVCVCAKGGVCMRSSLVSTTFEGEQVEEIRRLSYCSTHLEEDSETVERKKEFRDSFYLSEGT